MTLDRFREVAQEKTAHIQMTPALRARILAGLAQPPRRRSHRAAWAAVAACLVLMAVSAAALMTEGFGFFSGEQGQLAAGADAHGLSMAPPSSGGQRVIQVSLSYVEGIVPAQGESGLWGYKNQDDQWVCDPVYASVEPIDPDALCGRAVTVEGGEQLVIIQVSD